MRLVDPRTEAHRRGDLAPHLHRRRGVATGEHDGELLVLVGQLAIAGRVDVADLEQADAGAGGATR